MALCIPSVRGVAAAAILTALAACGGSSDSEPPLLGGGDIVGDTGDVRDDFTAMQDRLDGLLDTAGNAIPPSGTAEFQGFMKVDIGGASVPFDLTGTARITADFGASTLTGTAQDFEGLEGNVVSAYSGTIDFVDGRIGQIGSTGELNDVRLGYQGTLDGGGSLVTLDGEAAGKLKGSPIGGLVATSAPGETVTVGAVSRAATVTIVAETP